MKLKIGISFFLIAHILSLYSMKRPMVRHEEELLEAVKKGELNQVQLLLSGECDLTVRDKNRATPLIIVAKHGFAEIVALLLNKGADIHAKDQNGSTALLWAATNKHISVIAALLAKQAEMNGHNIRETFEMNGHNIRKTFDLFLIAYTKYEETLLLFITAAHVVDSKHWFETALLWSTLYVFSDIVKLLLPDNAYIKTGDVATDQLKITEFLINAGADINAKGMYSKDALTYAACDGNIEAVALLLDKGANIHARDDEGRTPLMWAATQAKEQTVILLLKRGANINDKEQYGYTALSIASCYKRWESYNGTIELLELCSQEGVDAYLKDPLQFAQSHSVLDKNLTTLMLACIFGHRNIVSLYKETSIAYLNTRNSFGHTAFDYALRYNPDIAATLITYFNAKINQMNTYQPSSLIDTIRAYIPFFGNKVYKGQELLEQAIKQGNINLVNALLGLGVQPTIELAQMAREFGYLKIMHRLLFATLASLPEDTKNPQILLLSSLFK